MSPLRREDYDAIEAAVMETARGRWFLNEYARRHRSADTTVVLQAVERLEKVFKRERNVPDVDRIRLDLADMAQAIERTKDEIAHIRQQVDESGKFAAASSELDAIVSQTEKATSDILGSAERIQEIAWTLRESGGSETACDEIDVQVTEIYTACSFQDLTGQRIQKVVQVLHYLEHRLDAMIEIWGIDDQPTTRRPAPRPGDTRPDAHLLNGPQLEGEGIAQNDVDALMGSMPASDAVAFAPIETAAPFADIAAVDDIEPADEIADDIGESAADPASTEADAPHHEEIADDAGDLALTEVPEEQVLAEADDQREDDLDMAWTEAEIGPSDGEETDDPTARMTIAERAALFT
ncbi:MAG: protein phosphatase CheZ [Hyphomicrobiales bacterium]|nr:protein phosphatase CheZ [Hyphomicrobiales bacterium]